VAGAQIVGGLAVPWVRRVFRRRTSVLMAGTLGGTAILAIVGLAPVFWLVVAGLVVWGLLFAAVTPVRQAYLNALIPSKQRATVLSFDNLLASAGGAALQPGLGRAADVWSYPVSYLISAGVQVLAVPFVWLARRENADADAIARDTT
jgi:MFS family permease